MTPDAEFQPGIPKWLAAHNIGKGEWTQAIKTQYRSLMQPRFPLKVKLWAFGMLHTVAYQTEEAVTLQDGKRRPIRPQDAIREIHRIGVRCWRAAGITDNVDRLKESRQNIRRAFDDLEKDGICERRRAADNKPFRELQESEKKKLNGGKVKYIFYFQPRDPDGEAIRQDYRERIAAIVANEADRSSHPLTTCSAEQLRSIRHIAKAFGLQDSPFFRLDENTPAEHVTAIMQAIERAKDSFIAACKDRKSVV